MPLDYTVTGNDGQEQKINTDSIVQQLQGHGEQVIEVSPDGSSIKLQDDQGVFEKPTAAILQKLGWQVSGVMPSNPDFSSVNSDTRAALASLPDDNLRQMYLKKLAENSGIQNPNIMGKGRDWYMFDPQKNQYMALSNTPDWDKQDLTEAMTKFPRFLGSVVGGGLGSAGGPLGSAAGAAAGGTLGDVATRGYLAAKDPALREVMGSNMGAMAKDVGYESALDAGTAGLATGVGGIFKAGPLSSALKGAGQLSESAGSVVAPLALNTGESQLGREVASAFIPGAGDMVTAGFAGQLPAMGIRGAAKGIGSLGESQLMRESFPAAGEAMSGFSKNLLRRAPGSSGFTGRVAEGAEEGARLLGGNAKPVGRYGASEDVEDILGNLGGLLGGGGAYNKALLKEYQIARAGGMGSEESLAMARSAIKRPARSLSFANAGRKVGRFIQGAENLGRGLENMGTNISGAALKGAGYAGRTAQGLGTAARAAGTLAQPLEAKTALRYGAEELLNPYMESRPFDENLNKQSIYAYQP